LKLEAGAEGEILGNIKTAAGVLTLNSVRAAYIRPTGTTVTDNPGSVRAAAIEAGMISWANFTSASIINRPEAMAANNSKPFQLSLISKFGLRIPETLVTTDRESVRRFCERHSHVIYKSVSGVRSIISRLNLAKVNELADVSNCPTQFQEYVPGTDVRVHVIGERVIATEIACAADDYRFASRSGAGFEMKAIMLPDEVENSCRLMARNMNLLFTGIDLRHTPDGCWYCFEANPSPGFTFFEGITGQPIAAAVADLLMRSVVN
jgi:glutathione synthase/RimK-type ligase-like ATP-grasp enzyme